MYGEILTIDKLPKDVKMVNTSDVSHYFTVRLFGSIYYIPIHKGSVTVLKKVGISKLEKFVREIINSQRIHVRDDVASGIQTMLSQQIDDGFRNIYGDNLFNMITNKMDENALLTEGETEVDNKDGEKTLNATEYLLDLGIHPTDPIYWDMEKKQLYLNDLMDDYAKHYHKIKSNENINNK